MRSKKTIFILVLLVLLLLGFYVYKLLLPAGPILDEVANPVRDRATEAWNIKESKVVKNEQRNLYWGDLHIHTAYSFDAFIGGLILNPDDAYNFARGKTVPVHGVDVKIERPLDFAAVTDHSEYFGELYSTRHPGAPAHQALMPRYLRSVQTDTAKQQALFNRLLDNMGSSGRSHLDFFQGFKTNIHTWDIELAAAEKHYVPGEFTTFAAYEWTLGASNAHLHRNIFFKDMVVPDYPVSALEVQDEEALWNVMDQWRTEGSTVMAVPHNSNLSKEGTFPEHMVNGDAFNLDYVRRRNRNEPLAEVHQAKGNSEVHPTIWESDEFSDFEVYTAGEPKPNNYIRHVLKRGMQYEKEFGINPFQYGLIGSTDTHNASPGNTEEDDTYIGNHAALDSSAQNRRNRRWILHPDKFVRNIINPGGLVAIWAKSNTRPELYEAMERKETYATSGTRMQLRFFATYQNFDLTLDHEEQMKFAYSQGHPMGSSLSPRSGQNPTFLIWATKDPDGNNLDRVEIIKGWYDGEDLQEKIYTVALSDNRKANPDGNITVLTNTFNNDGEMDPTKGAASLQVTWKDPDFDPDQHCFYYMRVIEVKAPRWTMWDEIRTGIEYPDDTPMTVHERGWSSPIWFKPSEDL